MLLATQDFTQIRQIEQELQRAQFASGVPIMHGLPEKSVFVALDTMEWTMVLVLHVLWDHITL